jgi:chromosome segregation ATPase
VSEVAVGAVVAAVVGAIAAATDLIRSKLRKTITPKDIEDIQHEWAEMKTKYALLDGEVKIQMQSVRSEVADKLDDLCRSFDEVIREQNRTSAQFQLVRDQIAQLRADVRELRTRSSPELRSVRFEEDLSHTDVDAPVERKKL